MKRECLVCNHKWIPKSEHPRYCPKCHASAWDIGHNKKCEICGQTSLVSVVHHKDGNRKNNSQENRMILCYKCHGYLHNGIKEYKITQLSIQNPMRVRLINLHRRRLLETWSKQKVIA